jgi:hypothetical protein
VAPPRCSLLPDLRDYTDARCSELDTCSMRTERRQRYGPRHAADKLQADDDVRGVGHLETQHTSGS